MNNSWLDQNRNIIFIVLLLLALGGGIIFYLKQSEQSSIEIHTIEAQAPPTTSTPVPTLTPTPAPVRVYITGAVVNSDVYFLPQGSIIKDAIQAAGGFTSDADPEQVNQALELKDQQQIHVPRIGEENAPPAVQGGPAIDSSVDDPAISSGQVNLNTATLEQLDALSGIGPAIAQRIIDYRENIGGFKSIEEITQVSGVGEATFAKIKDSITVE
jgi:competence protein ComEA